MGISSHKGLIIALDLKAKKTYKNVCSISKSNDEIDIDRVVSAKFRYAVRVSLFWQCL